MAVNNYVSLNLFDFYEIWLKIGNLDHHFLVNLPISLLLQEKWEVTVPARII